MNTKRLTILRDALIEYAKKPGNLEFDLGSWASVPRQHFDNHPTVSEHEAVERARARE